MLCGNASIHVKTTAKNIYFNQFIFQQQCMVFCTCQRVQYTAQKAEKFFTLFLIKRKTIVCWHFFFSPTSSSFSHPLTNEQKKAGNGEEESFLWWKNIQLRKFAQCFMEYFFFFRMYTQDLFLIASFLCLHEFTLGIQLYDVI